MPDPTPDDSALPESFTPSPKRNALVKWIKGLSRNHTQPENGPATAMTEDNSANDLITIHERLLLSNILKLRELKVVNVMIPRANIVAVEADISPQDLLALLAEKQYSRIPVYHGTLDNVLGTIHLKDVVAALARGEQPDVKKMVTDVPLASPSMSILNLLLKMRQTSRHMVLVVDEYGGIDGLVTIGNIVESIIGEIEDEHTVDEPPQIVINKDGTVLVDARLSVEEFDGRFGNVLTDEEKNVSDTMSGLVFYLAGHIPARGEIIKHQTGMVFEVLDADPRRINVLRISHIPSVPAPK